MATTTVSIRMDKDLKETADELFDEIGMSMSTAINIFIKKAVRTHRIPFDVSVSYEPTEELKAAIEEARRHAHDPNTKFYTNMEDLLASLNEEDENDL